MLQVYLLDSLFIPDHATCVYFTRRFLQLHRKMIQSERQTDLRLSSVGNEGISPPPNKNSTRTNCYICEAQDPSERVRVLTRFWAASAEGPNLNISEPSHPWIDRNPNRKLNNHCFTVNWFTVVQRILPAPGPSHWFQILG